MSNSLFSLKNNEILIQISFTQHVSFLLSEVSQTQRTNIVGFHLYEVPRIGKFIVIESRIEMAGVGNYYLTGTELMFGMMKSNGKGQW